MHGKRWRLFGVKRTQTHVARRAAGAFQANVFADRFDDVDRRFELLYEIHSYVTGVPFMVTWMGPGTWGWGLTPAQPWSRRPSAPCFRWPLGLVTGTINFGSTVWG